MKNKTLTLKFFKDFEKLNDEVFTTIRLGGKSRLQVGTEVLIKTPTREFMARIVYKKRMWIGDIPDTILLKDTGEETREKAIQLLEGLYQKDILPSEPVMVFQLIRKHGVFDAEKKEED